MCILYPEGSRRHGMKIWMCHPFFMVFLLSLYIPIMGEESGGQIPKPGHTLSEDLIYPWKEEKEGKTELRMRVGKVTEQHNALRIKSKGSAIASLPLVWRRDALCLSIVIPDDLEGHEYDFEIKIEGETLHKRSGTTRGFGLRSFFIALPSFSLPPDKKELSLVVLNHSKEDLYVRELALLPRFEDWLRKPLPPKDFTLSLLVNEVDKISLVERVSSLKDTPCVRKAISTEVYYMARTQEDLATQFKTIRDHCQKYRLSFVPIPCCWWGGTPQEVKDRIEFQQICWSDSDTYDEGPRLKEFLGNKWDIRYGLTIPNIWSSTPWQTMNHPELNRLRAEKLASTARLLERELKEYLAGVVSENEPAYWAFESADGKYPVQRKPLWADFNPCTVEAAKKDGVILDPSDGLDMTERIWLHYNLSNYIENTISVIRKAANLGEIYSHALLDYTHFPLAGTGRARPYAEAARVPNARLGVEMLWKTDMDALWRIREWGRWGCVNREEFDGFSMNFHIATLQAAYIMGSDMLNSYNWDSMAREGDPIRYFNEFLSRVDSGGRVLFSEKGVPKEWKPLTQWQGTLDMDLSFPWCNQIDLMLRCHKPGSPLHVWITKGESGAIISYRLLYPDDVPYGGPTTVDLGDIPQIMQEESLWLHLKAGEGWEISGTSECPWQKIYCDLFQERRRSLYVIERPSEVRTVPISLKSN